MWTEKGEGVGLTWEEGWNRSGTEEGQNRPGLAKSPLHLFRIFFQCL